MKTETIEPREVDYYDRLAEQWWDRQGKFWPLHRLNELRVEYLKNSICLHLDRSPHIAQPLVGISVIDIGCGGGILSESMAKLGATVHGIDVVEKSINIARQHSAESNLSINYEYASVEEIVERGTKYDVVLNMEVVEHVADLPLFMSACTRLLDADGIMFVATINRNPLSWLFAIVGAEYILGWLPRGTHQWRKFVRPDELERLLDPHGVKVTGSTGVRINPFSRQFSLSNRLAVNYMISAVPDS
ncbi:MAG: bifunctional 2-polyprenyl-6-hydroxyphenol methylase/3-demethylubiquinol 3-O-methyltransferase UbiG [Gammaproteobacteria bacterium]|nr:bifunctional 2-polyprenyl-6-hydroxyphenol methylase/3-demethylubiquinol 3-O-methyltransferase UbiG [Gammaproteobacteria bacterium]